MPIVNLTTLQDVLGGTEPVDAIVTAIIYRGAIQAIRIKDDTVIFPDDVRIKIINGVPVEPLILEHLEPDCYYKIDVFVAETRPYRANVVLPNGVGPFDIEDLIVVDPTTALPDAGTAIAQAFLDSVTAEADRAEAARAGMVVDGEVVGDNLILTTVDGVTIDAGSVRGAAGYIGSDGKSAYEVAVDNGFIGTEVQWLASIEGDAATIAVGAVTTGAPETNVIVANSGTSSAAIFDFTIPRGIKGDPGDTQTIAYTHSQGSVSTLWVVNHYLSFQPSVQVVDSAGTTIEGVVNYNSSTQLQIEFSNAVSGTAYLS